MQLYVFPGNIENDILKIAARTIPYMRTDKFSKLVLEAESMLLDLIGCPDGKVIFYTASGTGAMDAVVNNYVTTKKKAFIISGGAFGLRWKNICDYYKVNSELYQVPFAKDIDYCDLEQKIKESQPDALLCQHHETSTGQLFNLNKISHICQKYNISFIVDAISSFLADPLDMGNLHIDICITSSQKGLNIAPGLSFIILAPHILETQFNNLSYYFDFNENLKNLQRGQTPYSPATTLFLQLHERLKRNTMIGAHNIIAKVRQRAFYFRSLCDNYGWENPTENPSNCITGFFVLKNADILFNELLKEDFVIMPGGIPHYFRISHLGIQTKKDLRKLAEKIHEITLR